MSKTYIADKETLDAVYNIVAADAVYGFIEHNATLAAASRIEYIGANADYTAMTVDKSTGEADYGSWAEFPIILGNKPYMVKSDGTPDYQLDEDDYTLREDGEESDVANTDYDGGAFAWFPKVYKYEAMAGNDRIVKFSFVARDGYEAVGFIDPDGNELEGVWIPMFYGAIVADDESNNVMRSLSGLQPCANNTTAAEYTAISNVGDRACFFGGPIVETIIDILIMLGKSTNLQSVFGNGNCSGYDSTDTDTYGVLENAVISGGQFYGTSDSKSLNKIFHSVVLGSYQQYMRDPYTLVVNGRFKVSTDYTYDLTGDSYLDTGIDVPAPETSGWSYPHKYRTVPGFGALPVYPYNGSTATGGCDGFYRNASQATITAVARWFGDCRSGTTDGPRCVGVSGTATYTYWNFGAALLLLPPVGVAA